MAKKRKASKKLPYKSFRVYYRGKRSKKYYMGYISNLTGERISKAVKHKNKKLQGLREAFGVEYKTEVIKKDKTGHITSRKIAKRKRTDKTLKKISATIDEYKQVGMNSLKKSAGLERLFDWHKLNRKKKAYEYFVRQTLTKEEADEYLSQDDKKWTGKKGD